MSDASLPRSSRWRRWLLVYLLALGILAGPAYTMYVHYDFSHSLDTRSYLSMARGEFEGVSITRRYRVLVPAVAGAVVWPLEQAYARVWPQRATSEWPLRLAFYVVNMALLAAAGVVLFETCRLYGATPAAAALAVVAVLCSRWAVYTAGLPLVDSLYLLVVALAFYAPRAGSAMALVAVLLLGPQAKESFVFLVPWLLLFGRSALSWPRQLAWLALSGALTLGVRYWIDARIGAPPAESVNNALDHVHNITYSLRRLFSVKGAGEIFSIFGFFWLALLAGSRGLQARQQWLQPLGRAGAGLVAVVLIHMLLSGDLGRMGYLSAPVFAVAFSLILTYKPWLRSAATV
ncbi:hypothetical protein [Hymenobacter psychrotolerans]|uniref:DUF2029 domain-containing protein n=1 Tax=Hymenobacter psychrotolerans DSM 18569 TaxID=1121959 RepID=A0A1M6YPD2_9BACT|nr:hypothetical protein [Hymenobacter psychrotolerans]SHL20010.1 hypothetical protein SAMN02746009_02327 [Hymenobacter psychrotolerans DSM 18569]